MSTKHVLQGTIDFLNLHPPYSYLPDDERSAIANKMEIKFLGEGEILFEQGLSPGDHMYVLMKGQVSLFDEDGEDKQLVDVCEGGDSLGIRATLTGNPYRLTAKATKETLVYTVPSTEFLRIVETYPKVSLFFAAGFAESIPVVREKKVSLDEAQRALSEGEERHQIFHEADVIPLDPNEKVLFCFESNTIAEAAEIMSEYRIGSLVVVDPDLHPKGVITDTDFTRKLGIGEVKLHHSVKQMMSSPVITSPKNITLGQAVLKMMRHNIRHLVFTKDGSPNSELEGIISERDIVLAQGNNPAVLSKQISKATRVDQLVAIRNRAEKLIHNYLGQELSMSFIADTITEINDALIRRIITLSVEAMKAKKLGDPPVNFTWLSLGSEGRREQLLRTDQDNALLYDFDRGPETKQYFLALANRVNQALTQCGFAECAGGVMASNSSWCLSLEEWENRFSKWVNTPDPNNLMHGTIFFDFRSLDSTHPLAEKLHQHLFNAIDEQPIFLNFFAKNALKNPAPLSFFGKFILERSGEHKKEFDLKLRAMMPLSDIARLLMLHHKQTGITSTIRRYHRLAELEPEHAGLFREAAMAYEIMMRFRGLNGFKHNDSGRYIDPNDLNKIEKQTLKYTFRTIDALQAVVKRRFSLHFFGG